MHYMPVKTVARSLETRRTIDRLYQAGEPVESLARRFRRTPAAIARTIRLMRAERVMALPLDYVPNQRFCRVLGRKAEEKLVGPMPTGESVPQPPVPKSVPAYLASLYEIPILSRIQEAHLFRKMNYLKYKAAALRARLDRLRPAARLMDEIERCYEEALAIRNQIIRANLRLVVAIAKRCLGPNESFFELVSDGNMSLMRAVEKFDFALGNKFSTYAMSAIIKNFARSIPTEYGVRDRYRTGREMLLATARDHRSNATTQESAGTERQARVAAILARLDRRDRDIIMRRFGLQTGSQPLTLRELSLRMGITKERVRQLELRALSRLRGLAAREKLECLV
ncbi:MAG: sigma-70 family RNA polymerase sigma factor [Thermoguttaceae bacterium]|jgi:RNA polymerase sigma factor (sigma-70 family)